MHGNNPHQGLAAGSSHRGATRAGMDPDDVSEEDRTELLEFETDLLGAIESHLPSEYSIHTEYATGNQTLALMIYVMAPGGVQLQFKIFPTPEDDAEELPSKDGHEQMEKVENIAQQLAAATAHQFIEMGKQNGVSQRCS